METLTPQYTPGAPSSAMQTLEDKVAALQAQQEMENLRGEIHDLNEKLETLRGNTSLKLGVHSLTGYNIGMIDGEWRE